MSTGMFKDVNGIPVELSPEEAAAIQAEWQAAQNAPMPVPVSVTRRQAMAVLIKYGLDVQIAGALQSQLDAATASGNAGAILAARLSLNDYRESQQFERKWPLIRAMQSAFGWSDAYVDGLFIEAATL